MKIFTNEQIQTILSKHKKFLSHEIDGVCADLSGADLCDTNITNTKLLIFHCDMWTAYVQKDKIRIGCQYHTTERWRNFTNDEIQKMSKKPSALDWWNKNKSIIFMMADSIES